MERIERVRSVDRIVSELNAIYEGKSVPVEVAREASVMLLRLRDDLAYSMEVMDNARQSHVESVMEIERLKSVRSDLEDRLERASTPDGMVAIFVKVDEIPGLVDSLTTACELCEEQASVTDLDDARESWETDAVRIDRLVEQLQREGKDA